MSKFKVGDAVKFSKRLYISVDFNIGDTFRVTAVKCNGNNIEITPIDSKHRTFGTNTVDQFELVQNEPEYLTPEQVFKALQYKQELQYQYEYTTPTGDYVVGWRDCSNPQFANILNRNWRIKPVPKTIDYYGTELPKPITKAEAKELGLNAVYKLMLGLGDNLVKRITNLDHDIGDNLYFKTAEDALLVREAVLRPFKQ